jgi:hypothetical protein
VREPIDHRASVERQLATPPAKVAGIYETRAERTIDPYASVGYADGGSIDAYGGALGGR